MKKGLFITFEGSDGSGKTTISMKAYEKLKEMGYPVLYTREPGGIDIAEQIRKVILDPKNTAMDARCEALLYAASRRQHLIEKVLPALEQNMIVLCDRFVDSSLVYQGIARGIGVDEVYQINEFAIEGHLPDATVFLDVSLETGLARVANRGNLDRLDSEGIAFHEMVAKGYEWIKEEFKDRMHIVDANQDIDQVLKQTIATLQEIIEPYV
ncbi:dTMP kinase [[Eubacterium] hominis]|uniref:dTMP kinase n=1 Tax=[Eubacterium] hominis TaxID=2764325 RepID=UPI003A4D899B